MNTDIDQMIEASNQALQGTGRVDQRQTEDYEVAGGGFTPAGQGEPAPKPSVEVPPQQEIEQEVVQLGNRQDVDLSEQTQAETPTPNPRVTPEEDYQVQLKGYRDALTAEREIRQAAQRRIDEITAHWQEDRHFRETYEPHIQKVDALLTDLEKKEVEMQGELAKAREAEEWRNFYRQQLGNDRDLQEMEKAFEQQLRQERAFRAMENFPQELEQTVSRIIDQRFNKTEQKSLEDRQAEYREARERQTKLMMAEKLENLYSSNPNLEQFNDYFVTELTKDPHRDVSDLIAPFVAHQARNSMSQPSGPQPSVGMPSSNENNAPPTDYSNMSLDDQIALLKRSGTLR